MKDPPAKLRPFEDAQLAELMGWCGTASSSTNCARAAALYKRLGFKAALSYATGGGLHA